MAKRKKPMARERDFRAQFRPIPLTYEFPRAGQRSKAAERARGMLRGSQRSWGIPFELAREGVGENVLRLTRGKKARVPVGTTATHLCFLHYWEGPGSGKSGEACGEHVADYVLTFSDGRETVVPIRARYEIGYGSQDGCAFATVGPEILSAQGPPWLFALVNPRPTRRVEAVTLRCMNREALCIVGITAYKGPGHPLRHNARRYFHLSLPKGKAVKSLDVDMGVLVRDAGSAAPRGEDWIDAVEAGLGVPAGVGLDETVRLLEISAADGATLLATTEQQGAERSHRLRVGEAMHKGVSKDGGARLSVVHPGRTWLEVTVKDKETGKPTAARVHFSGPGGEYYPPYGHYTVINETLFEDCGSDLKLGQMNYACVPGKFRTNLPVGEVYVEVCKGFEYQPVRQKIEVLPGQDKLELTLERCADWRSDGWVTADTHVHAISPQTAWLQGQAEGVNVINLLAIQGLADQHTELFTNVNDITGEVCIDKDDTLLWVGTENRHHVLGHISLLGTKGLPVFPMSCGGPAEAYIGDPDERLQAEWADECRRKDGLVISPHFPWPNMENAVDMVLGKFDAIEYLGSDRPAGSSLDDYSLREYYRYLNCGYRVACVGGTDKMSATIPVGATRTYACLDGEGGFNYANWAAAIRSGRAFCTSGPLISLEVDGRTLGSEIQLKGGKGTVEVRATAECAWPMTRLEVVMNGRVVAATTSKGARRLEIHEHVKVKGSCWLAARCGGDLQIQHAWGYYLRAHTSPIYIVVPGTELFSPSDATYMLTIIDGGITYLDTLSIRYDDKRHREMRAIFEHARDHVLGRLHAHPKR